MEISIKLKTKRISKKRYKKFPAFALFNELIESNVIQNLLNINRYNAYKLLGRYGNNSNKGLLFNSEIFNELYFGEYNINFLDLLFISSIVTKTHLNSYINFLMTPNKIIPKREGIISYKTTDIRFPKYNSIDNDKFVKNRQIFTLSFLELTKEYLYNKHVDNKIVCLFDNVFEHLDVASFRETLTCSGYSYFNSTKLNDIFNQIPFEILKEINLTKEKIIYCFENSKENLDYFLLSCNSDILNIEVSTPLQEYMNKKPLSAFLPVDNSKFNVINQEKERIVESCFKVVPNEQYEIICNMEECEFEIDRVTRSNFGMNAGI